MPCAIVFGKCPPPPCEATPSYVTAINRKGKKLDVAPTPSCVLKPSRVRVALRYLLLNKSILPGKRLRLNVLRTCGTSLAVFGSRALARVVVLGRTTT
eukprot:13078987-Heterocapsa_arctica.AAC.1